MRPVPLPALAEDLLADLEDEEAPHTDSENGAAADKKQQEKDGFTNQGQECRQGKGNVAEQEEVRGEDRFFPQPNPRSTEAHAVSVKERKRNFLSPPSREKHDHAGASYENGTSSAIQQKEQEPDHLCVSEIDNDSDATTQEPIYGPCVQAQEESFSFSKASQQYEYKSQKHIVLDERKTAARPCSPNRGHTTKYAEQSPTVREAPAFQHARKRRNPSLSAGAPRTNDEQDGEEESINSSEFSSLYSSSAPRFVSGEIRKRSATNAGAAFASSCCSAGEEKGRAITSERTASLPFSSPISLSAPSSASADSLFLLSASARVELQALLSVITGGNRNAGSSSGEQQFAVGGNNVLEEQNTKNRLLGRNRGAPPEGGRAVPRLTSSPAFQQQQQQEPGKGCDSLCSAEWKEGKAATAAAFSPFTASGVSEASASSCSVFVDDTPKSYTPFPAAIGSPTGFRCTSPFDSLRTRLSDAGNSPPSSGSNTPLLSTTSSFMLGSEEAATAGKRTRRLQQQQKWWEVDAWRVGGCFTSFDAAPGAATTASVAQDLFALFTRERKSPLATAAGKVGSRSSSNAGEEQGHVGTESDSEDDDSPYSSRALSSSSSPSASSASSSSLSTSSLSPQLDEPFLLPAVLLLLDVRMYGRLCCVSRCVKRACESWATLDLEEEVQKKAQSVPLPQPGGSVAVFHATAAPTPSPASCARPGVAPSTADADVGASPLAAAPLPAVAVGGAAADTSTPLRYSCPVPERQFPAGACASLHAVAGGVAEVHGHGTSPVIRAHFAKKSSATTAGEDELKDVAEASTFAAGILTAARSSTAAAEVPGLLAATAATPQLHTRAVARGETAAAAATTADRLREAAAAAAKTKADLPTLPEREAMPPEGVRRTEQASEGDFFRRCKTRGMREERDAVAAENSIFWLRYLEENFAGSFNQELEYLAAAASEEKACTLARTCFAGVRVGAAEEVSSTVAHEEGTPVSSEGTFVLMQQPTRALRKEQQSRPFEWYWRCSETPNIRRKGGAEDEGQPSIPVKTYGSSNAYNKEGRRLRDEERIITTPLLCSFFDSATSSDSSSSESKGRSSNTSSSGDRREDNSSHICRRSHRRGTGSTRSCCSSSRGSSSDRLPSSYTFISSDGGSEAGDRTPAGEVRAPLGGMIHWSSGKQAAFSFCLSGKDKVGKEDAADKPGKGRGENLILEEPSPSTQSEGLAVCETAEVTGAAGARSSPGSGNDNLSSSICCRQEQLGKSNNIYLYVDTSSLRQTKETQLDQQQMHLTSSRESTRVSSPTCSSSPGHSCATTSAIGAVASSSAAAPASCTSGTCTSTSRSPLPVPSVDLRPSCPAKSLTSAPTCSSFSFSSSCSFSSSNSPSSFSFLSPPIKSDTYILPERHTSSSLLSASASSPSSSPSSPAAASFRLPPAAATAAAAVTLAAVATTAGPAAAAAQTGGTWPAAEALLLNTEAAREAAGGQQVCTSVRTVHESEKFASSAGATRFLSKEKGNKGENGEEREKNGKKKFALFTGAGNIDSLLLCLSARLTAMVLVSSAKYMRQWQEVGLLTGWLWFQRNILRRVTDAQLQRWGVRSKRHAMRGSSSDSSLGGRNSGVGQGESASFSARNLFLPNESAVHTLAPSEGQVKSSEHITWKMTVANWELFYESVLAEMSYRARMLAEKLLHSHKHLIAECDAMASDLVDVEEYLFCLPIFCEDGPLHEQQPQQPQLPPPCLAGAAAAAATEEASLGAAAAAEKQQEREEGGRQGLLSLGVGEEAAAAVAARREEGRGESGEAEGAAAATKAAATESKGDAREAQDKATEGRHAAAAAELPPPAATAAELPPPAATAAELPPPAATATELPPTAATAAFASSSYSVRVSSPPLPPSPSHYPYSSSTSSQQQLGGPLSRWRENTRRLRFLFPSALSLLKSLNESWDDYEEWAAMACEALDCLDFRINQEREACDRWWPHTPGLFDAAKLQFRNFCLLHSQLMRSVCLALYASIHEVEELSNIRSNSRFPFVLRKEQQLHQQNGYDRGNDEQQRRGSLAAAAVAATGETSFRSEERSWSSSKESGSVGHERKRRRALSRSGAYKTFQVFETFLNQLEALDVMDDGLSSLSTRERFRTFLLTPTRQTYSRVFTNYNWI